MNEDYEVGAERPEEKCVAAEQAVLGSVLIDSRCIENVVSLVRPSDFLLQPHKEMYGAIYEMYQEGAAIDPVTVLDRLQQDGTHHDNSRDYVLQLMEITPTAANVDQYARIVVEESRKRAIRGCAERIASDDRSSASDLLRILQTEVDEMQAAEQRRSKASSVDMFDAFLADVQTQKYKPIKTGMPSFDALLGGGLDPQSLVMIGAAPGMGKTVLCQQIFETMAANGREVIFLNLEMSREQLLARSLSRIAAKAGHTISAAQVMRGYSWTEPQRAAIMAAATKYRETIAPRMAYNPDGTGAGIDAIMETLSMALCAAKRNNTPAPVVVLDYLQLVQARDRQDVQEAIKTAIKALKDYAIEGQTVACAILAFNRGSNASGKVTLESGRDTSAIEYSADTLLGLNYAALEDGESEIKNLAELQQGELQDDGTRRRRVVLKLLKKRMTEAGKSLEMWFDGATATYTPIEQGEMRRLPDSTPIPRQWERSAGRKVRVVETV